MLMRPMGRPRNPVVMYVGGKWNLAPWIISHFPSHRCYVEPFGGMASVLMRKPRSEREIYNDINEHVVNLFRVMQDPKKADKLIRRLKYTPFARDEFELCFVRTSDPVEMAARLIVKCMMGFGYGRKGKTGFKGVHASAPVAESNWGNYVDRLPALIERFKFVVVENQDAVKVMKEHDAPDVLHYVDPPYVLDDEGKVGYYEYSLDLAQQQLMLRCIRSLKGMVVLSGYDSAVYNNALRGWTLVKTATYGMGHAAAREGVNATTEVLWINSHASKMRKSGRLF